ncbi:MAG TPA: DUF3089 domain-containing protein [Thermoleophilaceae bacterium]|jgi:hypothetical protein
MAAALVLVLAALAAGAGSAHAEVVWLCMPGQEPNPCRDSLETTVYDESGGTHVESPALPADPPADCFYVYPTVSEQTSRNANKDRDAAVNAIARFQASRFSQVCRVYAPVYRQQTLGGLALGGSAESLQLAYGDVEEAWREYLAKHNRGRPFVLLGHSQGTRMLRTLVRREIDGNADVRRRLVSGMLLGGNVTVRRGQTAGGDFANVPACTSQAQLGCVMAWSTFNEDPPENSRYGRVPAEDTSGLGFPAGPDYEVLCTNPASLGTNERRPLTTYLRGEPYPGVIGALLVAMYGGTQPTAPTAFVQPPDRYTGRCERRAGAHVLMLEPIGNARRLNPSPDPSWGLHLADGNIALGDLVGVTGAKIAAYRATRERPRLTLKLSHRTGRYARTRRCARGPIRASLAGADAGSLSRVSFRVGKGPPQTVGRKPFRATVGFGPAAGGQVARFAAQAVLRDGRTRSLVRHVRICAG